MGIAVAIVDFDEKPHIFSYKILVIELPHPGLLPKEKVKVANVGGHLYTFGGRFSREISCAKERGINREWRR